MRDWLLVIYRVPSEPSTARVAVWRKFKKFGALYIQQSVVILPFLDSLFEGVLKICEEVRGFGGDFIILQSKFTDAESQSQIIQEFNKQRDIEYAEIIEKCNDFFKEINYEIGRENFTYAELEENEDELEKLFKWYEKVKERDFFKSELQSKTEEYLKKAKDMFESFSQKVYENAKSL